VGVSDLLLKENPDLLQKDVQMLRCSGGTCNPSPWGAGAGGLQVSVQPGLHSETLSQTTKKRKKDV
jgi:hypothetical protein